MHNSSETSIVSCELSLMLMKPKQNPPELPLKVNAGKNDMR